MTTQRKTRLVLLPIQIYGLVVFLALEADRAVYGPEASSAFMMFAMWSFVVVGFLTMIGAVIQFHFHFRRDASLYLVIGLFYIIYTAANLTHV